jgi:hypothetical protein
MNPTSISSAFFSEIGVINQFSNILPNRFGRRVTYSPDMYSNEVQELIDVMDKDPLILNKNMLIGPSVATSGTWTPEQVWDTGYIDRFKDHLYALSVEQ